MRLLIQRVTSATVCIDDKPFSAIGKGLLVLLGITHSDNLQTIQRLTRKLTELRIFEDSQGKMNLSIKDVQGEILLVSQFTLYADCRRGRRPDFIQAANPQQAQELYLAFVEELRKTGIPVSTGVFAADMQINLTNDGPVTIMLDSDSL